MRDHGQLQEVPVRAPSVIPIGSDAAAADAGSPLAASAGQPLSGARASLDQPRRGPQVEVEDLDIPAFLRRHRSD